MPIKTKLNKLAKKRISVETFVVFLIILSPFIFKSHEYLPHDASIETINFLWFKLGKNGFHSIEIHGWFLISKLVPLYLMFIWFLTCKHWWYHIVLIPTLMYAFQIFESYTQEDGVLDSDNIIWILPICIVVIPFVYFIRIKLYDKHVHGIDLEAMDAELRILKEKEELRKERQKLEKRKTIVSKTDVAH